ncbi:MAG: hypothetical protein J6V33_02390 [Bacteroidales bacterium]|nr:hypothetical protein [Bacteroidales bacterium]
MNILKKIYDEKLSSDEAIDLIDEARVLYYKDKDFDGNFRDYLEMDNFEYTAYAWGCTLNTIAKWRYEGWPTHDCKTGKKINYKEYGWFPICIDEESETYGLTIKCQKKDYEL